MVMRNFALAFTLVFTMTLAVFQTPSSAESSIEITENTLANGLKVIVIPDRRAPVVSHVIWYKVGAADEPPGKSGIAHFLEHLMFKGTDKIGPGEYSKIIARNGGQDNAFTSQDITAYFQRIAVDRLPLVMEMEADRMRNLKMTKEDVDTEREVVLEERRSRIDNDPGSILSEQMTAALYIAHPYRIPIIGWEHEIKQLTQEDALAFYEQYYAPNNAILVVVGDVEADEVMALAEKTYGQVPAADATPVRKRVLDPAHRAPRRLVLSDERVAQDRFSRHYLAPSYSTAEGREAEALSLLEIILGESTTGRLYRKLVVEEQIASAAGAWFSADAIDYGRLGIYAVVQGESTIEDLEKSVDRVIADIQDNGVTEAELNRARRSEIADLVYSEDSQFNLARTYGWALSIGRSIQDMKDRAKNLEAVTLDDVQNAAKKYLALSQSVTGELRTAKKAAEAGETSSDANNPIQ